MTNTIEIPILSRKSRFVKKEDAGRQLRMYAILVKGEFGEEKQIEGILEHTLLDEIVYSDYDSILTEKSITNTENSINSDKAVTPKKHGKQALKRMSSAKTQFSISKKTITKNIPSYYLKQTWHLQVLFSLVQHDEFLPS